MGLKDAAKAADDRPPGVPTSRPAISAKTSRPNGLQAEADAIGYPVLIKAVAGGGGKGMRRVDDARRLRRSPRLLPSARRRRAFGDGRVLIEKWIILSPRHIEVQVFGDTHGNVVHLFERDCSLQRRHQKVIEEAPAPGMDEATREGDLRRRRPGRAAPSTMSARAPSSSLPTPAEGLRADRIWFMEMNTRLQVEHPVTEEITGVDLVEWQLRVASGEPIPLRQDELSINGWAMEARLYAEDPANGFLPSVGRLEHLVLDGFGSAQRLLAGLNEGGFVGNEGGEPVRMRVETGVEAGSEVSPFYDPMIAKLVVGADDRDEARLQLERMCAQAEVWPVRTNAAFLARLLRTPEFGSGDVTTDFIGQRLDTLTEPKPLDDATARLALLVLQPASERKSVAPQGFRLNADARATATVIIDGVARSVPLPTARDADWHGELLIELVRDGGDLVLFADGAAHRVTLASRPTGGASASDGTVLSPMPGKITAVEVADGQAVAKGDTLIVMEAMKMEQALTAPFDGTVADLTVAAGDQVKERVALVRVVAGDP